MSPVKSSASAALVFLVLAAAPTLAAAAWASQGTVSLPALGNARVIDRDADGKVRERSGTLMADPQRGEARFEADGRPLFSVSYDRITAMHWEESRLQHGFGLSSYYLTLDYLATPGQTSAASFHFRSSDDAKPLLAELERGTRLTVDHSVSTLLGLPIYVPATRAGPSVVTSFADLRDKLDANKTVYVESRRPSGGYAGIKGTVLDISASTIGLMVNGERVDLPEHDVLVVSERHSNRGMTTLRGLLIGLGVGVGLDRLLVKSIGANQGWRSDDLAVIAIVGGVGAGLGALGGKTREQLIFLAPDLKASRRFDISPILGSTSRGVAVSWRF